MVLMNKQEFLDQLRNKLSGLPKEDIEERISFYREMIEDHIDDGATEEEAVSSIGSVDEVVKTIMAEIPLSKLVKNKAKTRQKKSMPIWAIVLLVLGFPVWFPILLSLIIVVFSFYITLWSIIIAFYAVDLALAFSAIACVIAAVGGFVTGRLAFGLFAIGSCLVLAGLSILMFFGIWYLVKGVVFITGKMLLGIKSLFIGKES